MVDFKNSWIDNGFAIKGVDDELIIEQYVQDALDFSSQYGSDISISYTAYNISGRPSKYPDYGDFPQAFVMRTYGKWWDEAPSRTVNIMPQNSGNIVSQDYIDVTFEQKVYPTKVSIYETYNPGSVVRISAGDGLGMWKTLWEGEPQCVGPSPRIFSPEIASIEFMTCLLRIEFDHHQLDYYTELDAILLVGSSSPRKKADVGKITAKIKGMTINTFNNEIDIANTLNSLSSLAQHYTALLEDINNEIESSCLVSCSGPFDLLPDETILRVLSFLDLASLSRCARVNRHFNRLATDTMLYTQLNLKPYWSCLNARALQTLSTRCQHLQKLDLSWCGNYAMITSPDIVEFIQGCGKLLTVIRLNSCKYVDNRCIQEIAITCRNLKELCLRNCFNITPDGFENLKNISTLERLDLYRTYIESPPLLKILEASPYLKHINLGSCVRVSSMDIVAQGLGQYNRQLVSVDFWKTYSLTPLGVRALSNCPNLEEVDLGWCLGVSIPGDCMSSLANGCPKLKKLFMAALRGITDRDLLPFLKCTPDLEQVDLLGVRSITPHMCLRFLTTFKSLRLFDISFCDQIQEELVEEWRLQFPNVSIKRSFQSDGVPSPFQHY
ncbi:unnamed protein product [Nezara viridula]|uniref:F-box domain-containing protein n=1 Tax=Nezara viridula TaxID=85310 RepID=A0A9P0MVA8_NEZVI|nr:unnamed protein product [Nezara viridula]